MTIRTLFIYSLLTMVITGFNALAAGDLNSFGMATIGVALISFILLAWQLVDILRERARKRR